MSGKYFPKSSTCVKNSRELFSVILGLILSPEKKPHRFCLNYVMSCFLPTSPCNMGIIFSWWVNLFWSDKPIFPIFIFCKSFLTSQTCWQSFLHENLTMAVGFFLLILWQASMRSVGILHASLSKVATTFSSEASTSTSLEMITMSRYSRLEYRAFNQHCRSILTSLLNRIVLTCFVTNTSVCDLEKDSFNQSINQSIYQSRKDSNCTTCKYI